MAGSKGSKSTARRSAALSIRVDEKTKYGLELLSRIQRRSVTGVVEWAIAKAFADCTVTLEEMFDTREQPLDEALNRLWSVNELERLLLLATQAPSLLTYDEERMTQVLLRTDVFWADPNHRAYGNFHWSHVLPEWEKLRPLIVSAAERPVIVGLSENEIERNNLLQDLIVPF